MFGIYDHSLWVGFVGNSLTLLQRQPFEDTFVDYFLLGAWGSGRQRSLCLLAFLRRISRGPGGPILPRGYILDLLKDGDMFQCIL